MPSNGALMLADWASRFASVRVSAILNIRSPFFTAWPSLTLISVSKPVAMARTIMWRCCANLADISLGDGEVHRLGAGEHDLTVPWRGCLFCLCVDDSIWPMPYAFSLLARGRSSQGRREPWVS